jgi:hypothetical protein
MSSLSSLAAGLVAVVLSVAPGAACQSRDVPMSTPAPDVQDVTGLWRIASLDAAAPGRCLVALQPAVRGDGHGVQIEHCDLKAAGGADRWRVTSAGFVLVDVAGRTLIRFTPDTVDAWSGRDADGRTYRMTRAAME